MLAKLVAKADNAKIFVDCDPTVFRYILNFYRRGDTIALPENRDLLKEIRVEADYYGLPDLADLTEKELVSIPSPIQRADPFNGFVLDVDLSKIHVDGFRSYKLFGSCQLSFSQKQ